MEVIKTETLDSGALTLSIKPMENLEYWETLNVSRTAHI
jgi:hypothetical protein